MQKQIEVLSQSFNTCSVVGWVFTAAASKPGLFLFTNPNYLFFYSLCEGWGEEVKGGEDRVDEVQGEEGTYVTRVHCPTLVYKDLIIVGFVPHPSITSDRKDDWTRTDLPKKTRRQRSCSMLSAGPMPLPTLSTSYSIHVYLYKFICISFTKYPLTTPTLVGTI